MTDPEYGPVPEGERAAYHRLRDYAFDPEDGRRAYDEFPMEFGARRGVFVDGSLRAVCSHRTFPTAVRGRRLGMGGIAGVAAAPEHRRQGHVRRLLAGVLGEYREEGVHLCALYPFSYGFFREQGWALAERTRSYECDPSALAFADEGDPRGRFFAAAPDDHAALDSAYERAVEGYSLATTRSEAWWREHVFELRRDTPYVYAWEQGGEVRGYVSYAVSERRGGGGDGDGWTPADDVTRKPRRLDAYEFVAADPDARRNLLRFLYYHAPQVDRVSFSTPGPIGLMERAGDPRAIEERVAPGAMVRIVDVPAAIEALPSGDASGTVTLSVSDPLLADNDDTFALAFGDGATTCERTDDAPDARLGVGTLSQLAVGFLGPGVAERNGDLAVERADARSRLAAAFPERETYLPEKF